MVEFYGGKSLQNKHTHTHTKWKRKTKHFSLWFNKCKTIVICIVVIVYAAVPHCCRIVTATVDAVYFRFFFFFFVLFFCGSLWLCVFVCVFVSRRESARRITNVYNFADLCQCLLTLSIEQFNSAKCREAIVFPTPMAFRWTSVCVVHTNGEKRNKKKKNVKLHCVDIIEFIVTCVMAADFISPIFIHFFSCASHKPVYLDYDVYKI